MATLLPLALALLLAAPPPPAAPEASPAPNTLKDRVVAIVDEDPILLSDLSRVIAFGLAQPNPGESDHDFRRRMLGQLIDERLRFHEIDRFGFEQVPAAMVDQHVQEIRNRFKSQAELDQRLKEVGLTPAGLRQLVSRQLTVLTYVDERLGPKVFVSTEDIQAYYDDTLVPELQKQGKPAPPLEQVREPIRTVLREKLLNREIETWTDDLRRKADILNYFDDAGKPLPPVVKTIRKKGPR
jgi:hypothetical protein